MILAKGKLYGEEEREVLLARLEDEINETRVRAPLRSETVIAALDALGRHIENGQFDAQLAALGLSRRTDAVRTATAMLRRENLEYRLHMELGMHLGSEYPLTPPNGSARRICRAVPLGTVLHIAAGNADGLPVLSLAEGLLTGNINLLKLPQADGGLSVEAVRCVQLRPDNFSGYRGHGTGICFLREVSAILRRSVTAFPTGRHRGNGGADAPALSG